jgi:hypothetical protein
MNREFLIIGHPRSGTKYMSDLFIANGFDVQHETIGQHGTSNWQFAVRAEKYPFDVDGIRRQDVEFKTVIHVMRHPLHAINSIAFTEWGSDNFRASFIPLCGNQFERAIMSYYGWNMLIQSQQPDKTIALENAKNSLGFENDVEPSNKREYESLLEYDIKRQCNAVIWEYYIRIADIYNKLLK